MLNPLRSEGEAFSCLVYVLVLVVALTTLILVLRAIF